MSDHRAEVVQAIEADLKKKAMDRDDLATASEVSSSTIRQMLNQPQLHEPRLNTLKKIAKGLNRPPEYFVNILRGITPATTDPHATGDLQQEMTQLREEFAVLKTAFAKLETAQAHTQAFLTEKFGDVIAGRVDVGFAKPPDEEADS